MDDRGSVGRRSNEPDLIQVDGDVTVVSGVGRIAMSPCEGDPDEVDVHGNLVEERHKNRTADGCLLGVNRAMLRRCIIHSARKR